MIVFHQKETCKLKKTKSRKYFSINITDLISENINEEIIQKNESIFLHLNKILQKLINTFINKADGNI